MIKYTFIVFTTLLSFSLAAQPKKYQVNGAARGYLFANELEIDREIDTVTTRNTNYGHSLIDLGFSIFPNDNTEIISMFRIRNELGGFWGGGVSFDVRQLSLNGVAGGIVKYELGDIDLKLTPYTLFNTVEEGVVNEADIFAIRREIVHYDMFYMDDNTWRMQGANAQFGLEFSRFIKAMKFRGFITRQRPTDGIAVPERLYGGGSFSLVQSDYLSVDVNSINLFDLDRTIADSLRYSNSVHTLGINYLRPINDNISLGFKSEKGMSNVKYMNFTDAFAPDLQDDWFADAAAVANFKKQKTTISLGYKDVGADFFSPGAQTKRVNYNRFPGVYQQFTNNFIGRPVNFMDVINGNAELSFKISDNLMAYNIAYDNVTPYGIATPNRRGVYLNMHREDTVKFRNSFVDFAQLMESRGSGTLNLKSFTSIRGGTDIYLNDFFDWGRDVVFNVGVQHDITQRKGEEFDRVDFSSTFIDFGTSVEVLNKLDIMVGLKYWRAQGNEFQTLRNRYNTVIDFRPVNIDFTEYTVAAGLRYRFSEKNALSFHFQTHQISHQENLGVDYGIAQFNVLYSLMF